MQIDDMTIGQFKQLSAMFGQKPSEPHPFVGKYVLCRCYAAGVHAGTLICQDGDKAILKNSRRIWSWKVKAGIALSGLAQHGLKEGKIDTLNPEIALTGVCETIPCSKAAEDSINAAG